MKDSIVGPLEPSTSSTTTSAGTGIIPFRPSPIRGLKYHLHNMAPPFRDSRGEGTVMDWARILAYVTGTVDQELLARNEYLAAENRILKSQLNGRLRLS